MGIKRWHLQVLNYNYNVMRRDTKGEKNEKLICFERPGKLPRGSKVEQDTISLIGKRYVNQREGCILLPSSHHLEAHSHQEMFLPRLPETCFSSVTRVDFDIPILQPPCGQEMRLTQYQSRIRTGLVTKATRCQQSGKYQEVTDARIQNEGEEEMGRWGYQN